jgi:DNA-binding NtrC family response regulator
VTTKNVRALRPMRVLLVTDDDGLAASMSEAAALKGLRLVRASSADDLDTTATQHEPNVVALDARIALRRTARTATSFGTLHPRIAVVLVAEKAPARSVAGLRLVNDWRPPERLLQELELAYLGLD